MNEAPNRGEQYEFTQEGNRNRPQRWEETSKGVLFVFIYSAETQGGHTKRKGSDLILTSENRSGPIFDISTGRRRASYPQYSLTQTGVSRSITLVLLIDPFIDMSVLKETGKIINSQARKKKGTELLWAPHDFGTILLLIQLCSW